ncbi:MAG: hypothetical protein JWM12_1123, partial [Ilumatobacteraceae bacterium]|nr:hypothetical protein [Ilumatobacteraceae bacterium]
EAVVAAEIPVVAVVAVVAVDTDGTVPAVVGATPPALDEVTTAVPAGVTAGACRSSELQAASASAPATDNPTIHLLRIGRETTA